MVEMTNYTLNVTAGDQPCYIPLIHGVLMILLNVISSILGSIGNSLVCATIYTTTGLQTVSNYFLVSLAVADLLVNIVAQPLLVVFLGASLGGTCLPVTELLFRLAGNALSSSSVLHLCFISVDRCIMVIKPHTFSQILNRERCWAMLVTSWVLPIIYGALRLTVDKSATSLFTVVIMAICYVFIVGSYSIIIHQIRKQQKMLRLRTKSCGIATLSRASKRRDVERSVAMTIGIVIIIFTITWLPIIFLRSIRGGSNSGTAYNWARTFSLCNSAVNPWIYCYRIPQFRAAYKRLFILCQWGRVKGSGYGETTVGSESGMEPGINLKQTRALSNKAGRSMHIVANNHGKMGSQENIVATSDDEEDCGYNTPAKQTYPTGLSSQATASNQGEMCSQENIVATSDDEDCGSNIPAKQTHTTGCGDPDSDE